ncbi:MAG: OB-fold nucleic acid binding domain-containing protein, partial [Candidatus Falkowbacteria bacterium]|nr:OB-fold nucleic acid binding domain-containing protein [Candidatus Falkowbacteria bacterium]
MEHNNESEPLKSAVSERADRLKKLQAIQKLGLDPYPAQVRRDYLIAEVLKKFAALEKKQAEFYIVGRLRSLRAHGNLTFANLEDSSGQIQLALSKKDLGDEKYKQFIKLIDNGDFLEVYGHCFVT